MKRSKKMNADSCQILSESECKEIVRKSLELKSESEILLQSFKITRGSNELVGFMGEYFILDVKVQQESPNETELNLSFFIKSVPTSNEYHRDECLRKGFFGKETRVYTEILCNLQKFAPTKLFPECFYTRKDIIVLENLFATKDNFKHTEKNSTQEFPLDHQKLVIKHLSKLHAASLAWEKAENFNIGERFGDVLFELQVTMFNEWYVTGIKGIIFLAKMHPKFQDAKFQKFINGELYPKLVKACSLTDPSDKLRNVVCHRDTWDRNIFFKYNPNGLPIDCRIVDFQLTRYCPPGTDLLFFLFITTTAERRKEIYDYCLDFYYECLMESLENQNLSRNLISKEDFLEGCERAYLPVLIMWAICEPLTKMPEGLSNKMRKEEAEKFDFYMNTERNEFFTRIMEMDPLYKDTIMKPIEELIDYIM